jgi:type I restriction enzyme, S subunit
VIWPIKRLDTIADLCLGKMLDQNKNKGELRRYLANINVRWGSFELDDLREMRFQETELDRYGLKAGDIVMCEGGEPGRCAIWRDQMPGMMFQKALHRIRAQADMDNQFLFYALLYLGKTNAMEALFTGATIKHLPGEQLAKLEVPVPPLETQRRIASILGAYDDLIEVNRRRVKALEETARGLFKEWFVRFRFPGHETVPILDTPNGPLPEGWEFLPLGRLCEGKTGIQTGPFGSQLHQEDYSDEGIPVTMPKNILGLRIVETGIARIPEEIARSLSRHIMREGDIVYGRRGDIGRRAFISKRQNGWFCGTGCLRLRADRQNTAPRYLFDALGTPFTEGTIKARAQGATMPNLSAGIMQGIPVLTPPIDIQQKYSSKVEGIMELVDTLAESNRTLSASRDLLLPRLISGQLSVEVAERQLEAA